MLCARLSALARRDTKSVFPTATWAGMQDVFAAIGMPAWVQNAFFALLRGTDSGGDTLPRSRCRFVGGEAGMPHEQSCLGRFTRSDCAQDDGGGGFLRRLACSPTMLGSL